MFKMPIICNILQYFSFSTKRDVHAKTDCILGMLSNYLKSIFVWNSAKLMQTSVITTLTCFKQADIDVSRLPRQFEPSNH